MRQMSCDEYPVRTKQTKKLAGKMRAESLQQQEQQINITITNFPQIYP